MTAARQIVGWSLATIWALSGCSTAPTTLDWQTAEEPAAASIEPTPAAIVTEGDVYRVDVTPEPGATSGEQCLRLVVADTSVGCMRIAAEPGRGYGFNAASRVGDERVIWDAATIDDARPPIDHFVVWSSVSPQGRDVAPIADADTVSLVWVMESGEEPWGYESVADDGTSIEYRSFVGLPGA